MENDNCELLFEYLRSILYDSKIQTLDLEMLDEPYRKLGMGLQYLQKAVEEMLQYTADLARGNLSGPVPSRDNFLCMNLKNIHANLNHLTWQAKQVAEGDYSQYVSYLGDFSESFNTMTAQLKERENRLREEAETNRKRAEAIEGYMELLVELTCRRKEWILVIDANNQDILYCNKSGYEEKVDQEICGTCQYRLPIHKEVLQWKENEQYKTWEWNDGNVFYRCTTFGVEWRGRKAFAHIVSDATDEEQNRQKLTDLAYHDPGTGIRNLRFFKEYMEKQLGEGQDVTICYMDMDGLKFVNDHYGHNEGDCYIRDFVAVIQKHFRSTDVFCRLGGDEFCVILNGKCRQLAEEKLAYALHNFVLSNQKEYPVSFSYGVVEIDGVEGERNLEEIIHQADDAMYECKRLNQSRYPR